MVVSLNMKALILAAGEGVRMRPLTANIPKPLLLVAGKPFLQHIIEILKASGIKDIFILIGWRQNRIKEYFGGGDKFGVRIKYIIQELRLGTAHAIGLAKKYIKSDFICMNGDIVLAANLIPDLLSFHETQKSETMCVARVSRPEGLGVVELKGNEVKSIIEKAEVSQATRSMHVNAGIYVFTPRIFKAIGATQKSIRGEYEITDSLQILINSNVKVYGFVLKKSTWLDVSYSWELLRANEVLLTKLDSCIEGDVEPYVTLQGSVRIGKGTHVKNGTYIEGPVVIGKNCEIGPNCLIRGSTTIGDNCKVGNGVEVKNSIIMNNTHVPHLNYVGDSIIGERCNFGAGAKVANLRLDDQNVKVIVGKRELDTGRRKFGIIMGDDVKTGINCCLNVGTIIGENSFIGPGAIVTGTFGPRARIG
jgi:bifunctional UDP-N-acetylglucosamine pyrophosphorylase/glucosamine-1-phosphate N-acetyltransferase